MPIKRTKPTETGDQHFDRRLSHPSFGAVQISRVSGHAELFDSALKHQHYIVLRIHKAEMFGHDLKNLSAKEELIEVAMSETQFARMITSLNMGSGTACTIQHILGKDVVQPEKEDVRNSHRKYVRERLKNVMTYMNRVTTQMGEWLKGKHRPTLKELEEMSRGIDSAINNFAGNMEFYAGVFEEHMETIVEEAKTEIETHALATTGRLGLTDSKQPAITTEEQTRIA